MDTVGREKTPLLGGSLTRSGLWIQIAADHGGGRNPRFDVSLICARQESGYLTPSAATADACRPAKGFWPRDAILVPSLGEGWRAPQALSGREAEPRLGRRAHLLGTLTLWGVTRFYGAYSATSERKMQWRFCRFPLSN
jgi:hypothetical protein